MTLQAPDARSAADAQHPCAAALAILVLLGLTTVVGLRLLRPLHIDSHRGRPLGYRVDVNTADAATLELLPGVGPSIAQAIVAERADRPFEDATALQRVPMIGPRVSRRLAPYVVVGAEPAVTSAATGLLADDAPRQETPVKSNRPSADPTQPDA